MRYHGLLWLLAVLIVCLVTPNALAATYYFANSGSDAAACTILAPCYSIQKMNSLGLAAGDNVLFNRGDLWRTVNDTWPSVTSGSVGAPITYGSYGTASLLRPLFLSSTNASSTANWTSYNGTANLWRLNQNLTNCRIGSLFYNGLINPVSMKMKFNYSTSTNLYNVLHSDADFWFNITNRELIVRSTANPYTQYGAIEIGVDCDSAIWDIDNQHDIIFENLSLQFGPDQGFGGRHAKDITIRNNTVRYHGGEFFSSPDTRKGNAVQLYENSSNNLVEYNVFSEVLDAAYTIQGDEQGSTNNWLFDNITFRYNIAYNITFCFELYMTDAGSNMTNVHLNQNTCYSMGDGWYLNQRNNTTCDRGVRFSRDLSYASNRNCSITNNIFSLLVDDTKDSCSYPNVFISWSSETGQYGMYNNSRNWTSTNNLYYTTGTYNFARVYQTSSSSYRSTLALFNQWSGWENLSNFTNPLFQNATLANFTPANNSPACNMSTLNTYVGALPCQPPALLDTTFPTVTVNFPINDTSYTYYNGTINLSISEVGTCYLNDTRWIATFDNATDFIWQYNETVVPGGFYNLTYICTDLFDNNGTSYFAFQQSFVQEDSHVDVWTPDINYGTDTVMWVDDYTDYYAYISVNYSNLPNNSRITSATLYLFISNNIQSPYLILNYCADGKFDEDYITWSNQTTQVTPPCTPLYDISISSANWSGIWYTADLLSATSSEDTLDRAFTISVNVTPRLLDPQYAFISSQEDIFMYRPYVVLEYDIDTTPPVVTQNSYYTYYLNPNVTFTTDENADCQFDTADLGYGAMAHSAAGNGSTSHWFNMSTFTYVNNTFYVSCNDSFGNYHTAADNYFGWIYITNYTIFVYDELTATLINTEDVYTDIYNSVYNYTYNTSTGIIYFSDLPFGNYTILTRAAGYGSRTTYFDTGNGSSVHISVYLLNSTYGTFKTVKIIDENSLPVEDAKVIVYKEYPPNMVDIGQFKSNFEGEGIFAFIEDSAYYTFGVYVNDILVKSTGKTQVASTKTTLTIQLQISESQLDSLRIIGNTYKRLTLANNSGVMQYSFIWAGSNISAARLELTRSTLGSEDFGVDSNSSSASAGTLTLDFTPEGGWTYHAKAYIDTNTQGNWFMVLNHNYEMRKNAQTFGLIGLILTFLVLGTMVMMAADNPTLQIVLAIGCLVVLGFIGIMSISSAVIILLVAIGALIIFRNRT